MFLTFPLFIFRLFHIFFFLFIVFSYSCYLYFFFFFFLLLLLLLLLPFSSFSLLLFTCLSQVQDWHSGLQHGFLFGLPSLCEHSA